MLPGIRPPSFDENVGFHASRPRGRGKRFVETTPTDGSAAPTPEATATFQRVGEFSKVKSQMANFRFL